MRMAKGNPADDRARGELVGRLLDLARENGMEVDDESDLGELLERLSAGTAIPARAVLVMSEIFGYVFRYDRELALSMERERDGQSAGARTLEGDKIGD